MSGHQRQSVSIDHETAPWSSVKSAWQETLPGAGSADVDSRTIGDPLRGRNMTIALVQVRRGDQTRWVITPCEGGSL